MALILEREREIDIYSFRTLSSEFHFIRKKEKIYVHLIHLPSPYVDTVRRQLIAGDLNYLHLKEM